MAAEFRINPALDAAALAETYRRSGRLHIADFLRADDAAALHDTLRNERRWNLVFNEGEKLFELPRAAQAQLNGDQAAALDRAIYQGARSGFQFRYESIRVPDGAAARRASGTLIDRFARFLSAGAGRAFLRAVTGEDFGYVDAQATAYGLNHFLTAHDDDVAGKNRRAAYVFNLNPQWSADWGGLLLFHGADGHVAEGLVPRFNALNIFAVPQPHSVSMVTPFSPVRRYAVTGWMRGGEQPA